MESGLNLTIFQIFQNPAATNETENFENYLEAIAFGTSLIYVQYNMQHESG